MERCPLNGRRFWGDLIHGARNFLAQIDDVERFADKIKSAAFHRSGCELLRVEPGQYDYGAPWMNFFNAMKHDQTVGFWHNQIEQHDVGPRFFNLRQRHFDGIGFDQRKIFTQNHLQRLAHADLVVHYEESCRGHWLNGFSAKSHFVECAASAIFKVTDVKLLDYNQSRPTMKHAKVTMGGDVHRT